MNKIPLRKGAPLISQRGRLSREGGKGKRRGTEVLWRGSEAGSGVGLPASGSRWRAGAMSCHTVPCCACAFTYTQPSHGFPKPSLATVVLALARTLPCSDLSQGKENLHNALTGGERLKAAACKLLGLCETPWGGQHLPGQAWLLQQAGRALGCSRSWDAAVISGGRKRQRGLEKMKEPPAIRRRPSVQPSPFHSSVR